MMTREETWTAASRRRRRAWIRPGGMPVGGDRLTRPEHRISGCEIASPGLSGGWRPGCLEMGRGSREIGARSAREGGRSWCGSLPAWLVLVPSSGSCLHRRARPCEACAEVRCAL